MSGSLVSSLNVFLRFSNSQSIIQRRLSIIHLMRLRCIGFCGVDDSVNPFLLLTVSTRHPWVEWGVLLRSDKEGLPRYPSEAWIENLSNTYKGSSNGMRLAAHLCGDYCQRVLDGDHSFMKGLIEKGFKRFQINATRANGVYVNRNEIDSYIERFRQLMDSYPKTEFIIQANIETEDIWRSLVAADTPANMSILFDASCGTGKAMTEIDIPFDHLSCGYAGGIGPSNLRDILTRLTPIVQDSPIWVDMESSLRRKEDDGEIDVFNLDSCVACIDIVIDLGLLK